jgi:hypothetical protein
VPKRKPFKKLKKKAPTLQVIFTQKTSNPIYCFEILYSPEVLPNKLSSETELNHKSKWKNQLGNICTHAVTSP